MQRIPYTKWPQVNRFILQNWHRLRTLQQQLHTVGSELSRKSPPRARPVRKSTPRNVRRFFKTGGAKPSPRPALFGQNSRARARVTQVVWKAQVAAGRAALVGSRWLARWVGDE